MTLEQIVTSLKQSFQLDKYYYYYNKVKQMDFKDNHITIQYDGPMEELLNVLAQVHFCIQHQQLASGPFIVHKRAEDQYELTVNPHYYCTKPVLSTVILQVIPSELIRKISTPTELANDDSITLEFSGTFYVYYKEGLTDLKQQEIIDFFTLFATKVAKMDDTKIAMHPHHTLRTKLSHTLKVGYMVNKQKIVQLLKQLGEDQLQVTHLTFEDVKKVEHLSNYDCLIIAQDWNEQFEGTDFLQPVFPHRFPIYESYRKMVYPKNFVRKGHDLYGYANLIKSYLIAPN